MTLARRMLDTNTVSHLVKGHREVAQRLIKVPMASLCISVITEGELLFGLAKRPEANKLHALVHEFLRRIEVLPWDSVVAAVYGRLRASLEKSGKTMGSLDLLIGAHSFGVESILVTNDKAFNMIAGLQLEDWTRPI